MSWKSRNVPEKHLGNPSGASSTRRKKGAGGQANK